MALTVQSRPVSLPTAGPPPPPAGPAPLRLGSKGPEVSALQEQLNKLGEQLPVNGTFGPRTQEAVRRFQLARNIQPANGIVNAQTAAALKGPAAPARGWTPQARAAGDSFQAAPRKAPMSLSSGWQAVTSGAAAAGRAVERGVDAAVFGVDNAISAHGAKSSPNQIRSENKVLPQAGHFSSRTEGQFSASADSIRDLILGKDLKPDAQGNVGWARVWKGSDVQLSGSPPDGKKFTIWPLGKQVSLPLGKKIDGPKVNIELGAAQESKTPEGLREIRVPMKFSGDFTSAKPGEIRIRELPNGKRELSFNWPDAMPTGNIPDPGLAAVAHTTTLEKSFFAQIDPKLAAR
jgi:peptidoglycan hydrolase-like protein with peptidoglycan-binding domain